ncbi:MAG: hypothetical protein NVSMB31_16820 [Vulcanimicrobiaceae bacterium]
MKRLKTGLAQVDVQAQLAGALCALVALWSGHFRSTNFNNYVRLAEGWLHGHAWIDWPGRWMDAALFEGHRYTVDGPLPAVFALPFVPFMHLQTNQTYIAAAVCALMVAVAYALAARLGLGLRARILLTVFLFAGTDVWWCAELGDVWFLAHLSGMLFTFLALWECLGRKRAVLVGLYAFCAFESRAPLLFAVPLYAYLLCAGSIPETAVLRAGKLVPYGLTLLGGVAVWMGYNEWQWGVPYDIGHTLYYHQDGWGSPAGSPFSLSFLPYQLYSFFIQGPVFVEYLQHPIWPYLKADPKGIALTFTSPALALAFWARRPAGFVVALWVSVLLVAAPDFLYYLNGWYQFGMRHALDFVPFLWVLMAYAVRDRFPPWGVLAICWSAAVGMWGVWFWNVFFRTGG